MNWRDYDRMTGDWGGVGSRGSGSVGMREERIVWCFTQNFVEEKVPLQ